MEERSNGESRKWAYFTFIIKVYVKQPELWEEGERGEGQERKEK